jgi:NAD(P)-dependent dehydrogenase (short-subunit alcohol dehydrogenase family)
LAIAKEFAEHGATVVMTGRDQRRLEEAVAKIGPKASGVRADAGSEAVDDPPRLPLTPSKVPSS